MALKVLAHDADRRELEIMKRIAAFKYSQDSEFVVKLLDHFDHTGPNGEHLCLVLELAGESLEYFFARCFAFAPAPLNVIKRITDQTLRAIEFFQRLGFVHHGFLMWKM